MQAYLRVADAQVSTVVDISQERVEKFAKDWPVNSFSTSLDDALKDVDLVDVCTSPEFHAAVTVRAANAGKHIFCEKPMATTMAQAEQAALAVKRSGVKYALGLNRRFDGGVRTLKRLLSKGEIGEAYSLSLVDRSGSIDRVSGWRRDFKLGGGVTFDRAPHYLDTARVFMGDISEVTCYGHIDKQLGVDVSSFLSLRFANGGVGSIALGFPYLEKPSDVRMEVLGKKGEIRYSDDSGNVLWINRKGRFINRGGRKVGIPFTPVDTFQAELSNFIQSIIEGSEPEVDVSEALENMRLLAAAIESLRRTMPR
jgi:myo-inositol 2-dehydrogenase/D-chiro-inositol 1-dehydrogenase